jgi:hypothetical protein
MRIRNMGDKTVTPVKAAASQGQIKKQLSQKT